MKSVKFDNETLLGFTIPQLGIWTFGSIILGFFIGVGLS